MNNSIMFHGDVLIKPIEKLPNGLKSVAKRQVGHLPGKDIILAEGEVTGHAHRIICEDGEAELFERNGTLYLKVNQPVQVSHEEHNTNVIAPGAYEIGIQREWNYLEQIERRVAD